MKIIKPKCYLIIVVFHICALSAFSITANFTYTKRSNCAPTIVEFTNNSTSGTGATYTWDFGLGSVVTASDNSGKEQLYSSAGQYTVKLTVSYGGETASSTQVITISNGPDASFTATPLQGCVPLTVKYTSTSTAGDSAIVSTLWDFRNGSSATGTSTQYTYSSSGKYDVVLKVIDSNGCYSLIESDSLIDVVDKPSVNFTATDTFACTAPLNVTFINLSTGATDLTYKWDYGNGKTSTDLSNSTAYYSTGTYDVKLVATDQYGCTDSLTKKSYIKIGNTEGTLSVYDSNNNIVTKSILCSGTYKFVFSISGLTDYTWTITDNNTISTITGQDSISYVVKDSGTLEVRLIYGKNSYCTDTLVQSFTKSYVTASFTLDPSVFCGVPQKITLQNSSVNADDYSWYFSGSLFSNSSDTSLTITKSDLPAETYEQLYSHAINTDTFSVKLIASNAEGCSDTITKEITISLPVARFMPDKISGCIPLQVSFSDSSHSAYGISEYIYKIGNDSVASSTGAAVTYTFTKAGEYYVSEIIKSGACSDTSYPVKIVAGEKLKPDLTVTPAEVCNGGTIQIVGSSNNDAVVTSWQIKSANIFDLNFTSKPDTSIVIYSDTLGTKHISLSLDYNGCISDTSKTFNIKGQTGNFIQSFSCDTPLVYHFKSKISPATSLAWTVDTAKYSGVDTLDYTFPKSGNYIVTLTATDGSSGCTLTRTKTLKVRKVDAAFTLADTISCTGDTVYLNSSTSVDYISNCYNEGFLWDFGDKSASKRTFSTNYYHVYTTKGTYKILLTARADNGCTDTLQKTIHIYQPEGSFTTDKDSGCVSNLTVNFKYTSTDSTIISWNWNFGDGSTDSTKIKDVAHTYTSSSKKTYNSTLTVYDAYGCYSNTSKTITLISINSDFQADDNAICAGQTITFTPVDSDLDSLYWSFGDGSTSEVTNAHTYNSKGEFTVSLAASKNGCRDTVTKTKYVSVEKADASFTVSDSILYCYPDTLYFINTNLTGSTVVDRVWTLDSKDLTSTADSIKYVYTKPGTYTAKLTVTTLNNCQASSSKNIVITGPTAHFSYSPKEICYNGLVTFLMDSISDVSSWKWLFGDGNTSTDNPASHRYTSRGTIVPSITLINAKCTVTKVLDTLSISNVKADFYNVGDSLTVCLGNSLSFLNRSTNSTSWDWKIDGVQKSTDYDLTNILFTSTGSYSVMLIATGTDNCTDTLIKKYTVEPLPNFTITGDSIMCQNMDSIVLKASPDSTGWTIAWTPTSGLSSPTAFTTIAKPSTTTTYTAVVTNAYGCSSSRTKTIVVNQSFNFSRSPVADTSIYIGDKIQLIVLVDSGNVTYSWSPNYNISCLNCYNPYVWPTKDVTYKVEIKNTCFDFIEYFNIKIIIDFYLEAPTAFSPNGDSNNDTYKFEEKDIKNFELKIFNRWGDIVFSTTDIDKGWDGNLNGHAQNIDTYTYFVKAESIHGYKFEKKGSFLLLK